MATYDSEKAATIHRHLHTHLPTDPALRVKALESLLVQRGIVASETLDAWIEAHAEHIGPKRGAHGKVIAHHGAHLLPDKGVHGIHAGEHLYTVAFAADELWGEAADSRDSVALESLESCLVSA